MSRAHHRLREGRLEARSQDVLVTHVVQGDRMRPAPQDARSFAEMELHTDRAQVTVDLLMTLGVRDPEMRAAADGARVILERLDAALAEDSDRARAAAPARVAAAEATLDR
jgi:hypothetical protein